MEVPWKSWWKHLGSRGPGACDESPEGLPRKHVHFVDVKVYRHTFHRIYHISFNGGLQSFGIFRSSLTVEGYTHASRG